MRLIQESRILEVCHHVPDSCCAQAFLEPHRNDARRDRLARLNIRPDNVRPNLAGTPFLKRWIPQSSRPTGALTLILENGSSFVNPGKNQKQPRPNSCILGGDSSTHS